ncbi:MAG: SPOR domain-containing protein [Candidatus Krumholzibacteriia bacterium]
MTITPNDGLRGTADAGAAGKIRRPTHTRRSGPTRHPARLQVVGVLLVVGLAGATAVRAGVLEEVRELRREMHYRDARDLLEAELGNLRGEERAQALLLLASLSTEHKEVRRLLREASRASGMGETKRRADLALARLDFARGNYNSVRTRLRAYDDDEATLLVAQAFVALGQPRRARQVLQVVRADELPQLLVGWADREVGDTQGALVAFEQIVRRDSADTHPTALLWKAECEAELGLRERALDTAAELQGRFADSPEAVLVEPTLAALRRAARSASSAQRSGHVVLQIGAFEDRVNALRFRDRLPHDIRPVSVDEVRRGMRRLYRVHVGPFETRERAEAYAREHLDPLDIDWRIARPEDQ